MAWLAPAVLFVFAAPVVGETAANGLSRFLLPEARELALARSAAPSALSERAALFVLGPEGYRPVKASENGFSCLVMRSFTVATTRVEEFYDPRLVAPICFNEEASRTVMPREFAIAKLVALDRPLAEIKREVDAGYASGTLKAPRGLALAYMLSSAQWLGEGVGHWHPHVMVFVPHLTNAEAGGFGVLSGWPIVDPRGGPFAFVAVPVARAVDPVFGDGQ